MQGIIISDNKEDWILLQKVYSPWGNINHNELNNPKAKNYDKGDLFNFNLTKPLLSTLLFLV